MPNFLIAFNDEWVPEQTDDGLVDKGAASRAVVDEMKQAGIFVFSDGGIGASTALCTVEARDGKPVFTDGAYPESKEHVGGFCIIDVPDEQTARYWAGRLAVVLEWPQEIHEFGHHHDGS